LGKYIYGKEPQQKLIANWCDRAKKRLEDRNIVVHGSPGIDPRTGKITLRLYSAGKAFEGGPDEWSAARVKHLALEIRALEREVETLLSPAFDLWTQAAERYLVTDFVPSLVARRRGGNS
jgi:hypothetical protein